MASLGAAVGSGTSRISTGLSGWCVVTSAVPAEQVEQTEQTSQQPPRRPSPFLSVRARSASIPSHLIPSPAPLGHGSLSQKPILLEWVRKACRAKRAPGEVGARLIAPWGGV